MFTIINADNGKTVGTTLSGDLAQNSGVEAVMNSKGEVILDEVNGRDYLDSVRLQGMAHSFMFQQPDNARSQLNNGGHKITVEARTGGQE